MTKLASLLAAVAIVVAIGFGVSWGAERLLPLILSHPFPKWLPRGMGAMTAIAICVVVSWQNRGAKPQEDERLTPLPPRSQRPL